MTFRERLQRQGDRPRVWSIREFGSRERVAVVDAETETDALAEYACLSGYADPREFVGTDDDFFHTLPDGTVAMTYENTDLYAVPADTLTSR